MSFTKTLTAIVAALYLSIGSAGAEEPKSAEEFLCRMAISNPKSPGAKGFYEAHSCEKYEKSGKPQEASDKTTERQLSCSKEWNDLFSIVDIDGERVIDSLSGTYTDARQLKLLLGKSSSVEITDQRTGYGNGLFLKVYERDKKNALKRLTRFRTIGDKLYEVNISVRAGKSSLGSEIDLLFGSDHRLDLSNPKIRQAAERKFCGYVKQALVKYDQEHRPAKKSEREQLKLLK